MTALETRLRAAFARAFGSDPALLVQAPGRVNLIGEHTDYNDGFVLPMAIGCGTMIAASPREDAVLRLHAVDLGKSAEFRLDQHIAPCCDAPWSNYVRGVAQALQQQGLTLQGADMAIAGDLPRGAGLSSSASLEVAAGLALAALAGASEHDRTALALAGQSAEHNFAGCQCGIMDQLVSARGEAGSALLIDCRSLAARAVAMPADAVVMIVHSGIERGLVEGEYNARRAQCEAAARHFGVAALRDLDEAALVASASGLDSLTLARARHVVSENARTLAAAEALARGDLAELGRLMAASHASMRDDFAITLPAIDALAGLLQQSIGSTGGARMTGGGFGGAVVAIMPREQVGAVRDAVLSGYCTPSGNAPLIMLETARRGASIITDCR